MRGQTRNSFTTTWLALLAVALLFVAPVISKSINHRITCQHTAATLPVAEMHTDISMPAHCTVLHVMDYRMMSGHAMSPMEEIACGYCQLLIHLPFVQFMLAVLPWLRLLFVMGSTFIPIICVPIFRAKFPQRARAPPAIFLSPIYSS